MVAGSSGRATVARVARTSSLTVEPSAARDPSSPSSITHSGGGSDTASRTRAAVASESVMTATARLSRTIHAICSADEES